MKKIQLFIIMILGSVFFNTILAHPNTFTELVKTEREKVVHITTTSIRQDQGTPYQFSPNHSSPYDRRQTAFGSGFIISKDGYVVTNNHVVTEANKIEVLLLNGESYIAKIVGTDPRTDIALLKIDVKNVPFVKFGDSKQLAIGAWVVAIGNPYGLDYTVTAGILSARDRDIFSGTAYGQFLQTDAAINQGNSGGPLFNLQGEVIGINTAIIAGGQGIGFAIPSNLTQKIIQQLKEYGEVRRGWLGVSIQNIDENLSKSFQLPDKQKGVAITGVLKDSPAQKSGIQQGDVIIKFDGKDITKVTQLQQTVAETSPDSKVKVVVYRDGKELVLMVQVGNSPRKEKNKEEVSTNSYGFVLSPVTQEIKRRYSLKYSYGLIVVKVDPAGIARDNDIQQGDIILEVNRVKVESIEDFNRVVQQADNNLLLYINRNNREEFRSLPVIK